MKPDMLVMLEDVEYKVVSPVNAWLIEDAEGNQMEALESTLSEKGSEKGSEEAPVEDKANISLEDLQKMTVDEWKAYKAKYMGAK